MGYREIQESVVRQKLDLVEILRFKPVGYYTVLKNVDKVKAQIAQHQREIDRHTEARNYLENFLAPYLHYQKLLNNSLSQTIIKEEK